MLAALIWDVDGSLAETERDGHLVAFNQAFEALGRPWRWSVARYGELLRVTGGRERLHHDLATRPDAPADPAEREALIAALHAEKNRRYAQIVASGALPLRPGVARLLREATAAGLRLAIATTTSRANVDALLGAHLGSGWAAHFAAVVCAEDAPRKKPDPQVYRVCLERLGLDPEEALAIEDSANGLAAASAAGLPTLVTRSVFFAADRFDGALAVCDDLESPAVPGLARERAAVVDVGLLGVWQAAWWRRVVVA